MVKILASDGMQADAAKTLETKGHIITQQFYAPEQLAEEVKKYNVMVVRSATKVREPIIDAALTTKELKLIIRGGVGIDNIDYQYAESKGIKVTNTPKASSASVAELALGHMFSLARFVGISNVTMRQGEWNKKIYEGIELNGKTLGLIGMGRISQELAKRAQALGMNVIYNDIIGPIEGLPYQFMSMNEVFENADFISLHIPAPEDKKPVIGVPEISLMKPTSFLINTARGTLIDPDALITALDKGELAGAALDVYPTEPAKDERLLAHPLVSVTPHIGGSTKEAQLRIGAEIVEIIDEFFA